MFRPESVQKPFVKQEPVELPFQVPNDSSIELESEPEKKRKISSECEVFPNLKSELGDLHCKKKMKFREFDEKDLAIQKQLMEGTVNYYFDILSLTSGCSVEDILSGFNVVSSNSRLVDLDKEISDDDDSMDEYFRSNDEVYLLEVFFIQFDLFIYSLND
jgi:hypothetical protein